jgi:hypothetical protein
VNSRGNTLTPFGTSLGLVNSDINGNLSHNVFTTTGGLNIVDTDPLGEILSLAGRETVPTPEPSILILLVMGMTGVALACRQGKRFGRLIVRR